jgi:CopG family nickel-responsive transcriptional regulator
MQRITVTVDDDLCAQFDRFMAAHGYTNRSEAFRDLLRERLERERLSAGAAPSCVACVTYVYDHEQRELARRLVSTHHSHHDLSLATLHVHLDHSTCLETTVLRGPTEQVTDFAQAVTTQRGVRHGHLWLVPAELEVEPHGHGEGAPAVPHLHYHPTT